jgi:hypothetical protein
MKTTVSKYDFERAFADADRKENFSYEGLAVLFDYLEELEDSTGQELELDVIALCCDYTEEAWADIADNYGIEYENDTDGLDAVRDYLNDNTQLVGETAGGFVYLAF